MSDLVSYFLIGRFPESSNVFINPLNLDVVPDAITPDDEMILIYICLQNGASPVGTIRCRRDSDQQLEYFHGFFLNHETPEDQQAMQNALLHIAAGRTGFIEPRAAENLLDDVKVFDSLGM